MKLQDLELERARLNQEMHALPGENARAEAALVAAQNRSAEISAALEREDTLRTRLEREIEGHRKKTARFRDQLDSVKTSEQAQAIEHEFQFAAAEVDRLENEEIASLERGEGYELELASARAQVESLAADADTMRTRTAERHNQLAAQLSELNAVREEVRKKIDPEWVARFDRLATSRGVAIVRAENQQCTGCRMGLRPQMWNELREGQLLTCDSCSRLIYWDPSMAPAPKAPQPALIPGQGRAPRKPRQAGA
ncbi:MAG TPA: C4-type zinc ribbon domain-containing protein [Terracidiphilus sp.]